MLTSRILLQSFFPHTFDGLCLIEPALKNNFTPMEVRLKHPAYSAHKRKDEWFNRFCLREKQKRHINHIYLIIGKRA